MKIKRRTFVFLIRTLLSFLGVVLTLLLIYWYFFTQFFVITSYDISGIDESDKSAIMAKLQVESKKTYFGLVFNNKILSYSNSLITKTIQSVVSEVADIDMRPSGLHTVHIEVTQLTPLFKISETEALTKEGVLFSTNSDIHNLPLIVIASSTVQTLEAKGIPFRKILRHGEPLSVDLLTTLDSLSSKVSSVIFPVDSILVEDSGDVTMFNKTKTSKVFFLEDMDPKKTWSTLLSAIDTDPLKSKLATEKDTLEYIDSRYGNKIFYRFSDMPFQNGKNTAILDHHATSTQASSTTTEIPR
jgi:hypothetical protein